MTCSNSPVLGISLTFAVLFAVPVSAATVNLSTDAYTQRAGQSGAEADLYYRSTRNTELDTRDFAFDSLLSNSNQSTSLDPLSSRAFAYANGDIGALRIRTGTESTDEGYASASASATITETFRLTGAGRLTALLKLDGWWDLQAAGGAGYSIQSSVCIACFSGNPIRDSFSASPAINGYSETIEEQILRVSVWFDAGQTPIETSVRWTLSALQNTPGGINFSNTGRLLVTVEDGLVATPLDPGFLSAPIYSDTADPSAVPLPASWMMSLVSVSVFLALARRCRSAPTGYPGTAT
ncbi:hypothetical protein QO034_05535 [Sedimentitalea sp. JM2-8]|uniref:PEP-CTERM protein-sorting domain-containing protein n=1 Tax=Sedimentitalea xiamensis TaxID=3050037 RepID=A0ABT7FBS6_9RHOB|nr:hypothetical protein [Sedimentitalea xiamensis]MDK3072564.1 hypothetical protein [Sedimentitalea xiamensis]